MHVISFLPIGSSQESAEVEISDGTFTCKAFCYLQNIKPSDGIYLPLKLFNVDRIMISKIGKIGIENTDVLGLAHRGTALVVNADEGILNVGKLCFQLSDYLPGGISCNDIIDFECARIDIN